MLPVYRGTREVTPAPRVGSIPFVTLRELGGMRVIRFVGTPLDSNLRSIVTLAPPPSSVTRRWVVSVRASGHVYPDLADPPVTITANRQSRSQPAASGGQRNDPPRPLIVGALVIIVAATAVARVLARGRGRRPFRTGVATLGVGLAVRPWRWQARERRLCLRS